MSIKRYYNPRPGEWIHPNTTYKIACCDCGLVHQIKFALRKGKIMIAFFSDRRATSAVRRRKHRFVRAKL